MCSEKNGNIACHVRQASIHSCQGLLYRQWSVSTIYRVGLALARLSRQRFSFFSSQTLLHERNYTDASLFDVVFLRLYSRNICQKTYYILSSLLDVSLISIGYQCINLTSRHVNMYTTTILVGQFLVGSYQLVYFF